jgi:hypothetical protein
MLAAKILHGDAGLDLLQEPDDLLLYGRSPFAK